MSVRDTRAIFARLLLGRQQSLETISLGSITLRPHQQSAVERARGAMDEYGGCLLCDEVGTGKTYVALALAAAIRDVIVVAPAVLKEMWIGAAASAGVSVTFVSTELLSRGRVFARATSAAPFVVVDEAHHFRNPSTRRFMALAQLCADSRVLLLTATPIHNRRKDLDSLLSLFIGSKASQLSPAQLGQIVIRRGHADIHAETLMPDIEAAVWCELTHDDEIPALLLSLPPPVPPSDGGDGGALIIHSLIRQWMSSDAALYNALVRRLQKATALIASLESGSHLSRAELSMWISGPDCVQLGFTELLAQEAPATVDLLSAVRAHGDAIRSMTRRLRSSNVHDLERARIIRDVRKRHGEARVVAFSQYADTVEAMFRLLAPDGFVAMLNGTGARVAGGRISRAEAIGRFAPRASGRRAPRLSEAVTLLLTTDLLSEGVNLQDASVVIHLDLPWTHARLEQRVGRVARMTSPHARVFSYVMRPPASGDSLIGVERILRDKMISSRVVTDSSGTIFSGVRPRDQAVSVPGMIEELRSILIEWMTGAREVHRDEFTFAAVAAPAAGFVSLCRRDNRYKILAGDAAGVSEDLSRVMALMRMAGGHDASISVPMVGPLSEQIERYLRATRAVSPGNSPSGRSVVRRQALDRIAAITINARPHDRPRIASSAQRARTAVLGRLGAAREEQLAVLSAQQLPDEVWLSEVAALAPPPVIAADGDEIVAILLLVPDEGRVGEIVSRAGD